MGGGVRTGGSGRVADAGEGAGPPKSGLEGSMELKDGNVRRGGGATGGSVLETSIFRSAGSLPSGGGRPESRFAMSFLLEAFCWRGNERQTLAPLAFARS